MFNFQNLSSIPIAGTFILLSLAGCKTKMVLSGLDQTLYRISPTQRIDSNILEYYQLYKTNLDSPGGELRHALYDIIIFDKKMRTSFFDAGDNFQVTPYFYFYSDELE
jgi:hypothetical protein